MLWHDNSKKMPKGSHAVFGGSKKAWHNYTPEEAIAALDRSWSTTIGTEIHELAAELIFENIKMDKRSASKMIQHKLLSNGIPRPAIHIDILTDNFVNYVNDAIGFMMEPEKCLFYSQCCNGTADAISFSDKNNYLRIHDLKTGLTPASMEQLRNYAAFFCLEYNKAPGDLQMELRIYQGGEVIIDRPSPADILPIMDQAIRLTKIATNSELIGGFEYGI